MIVKVRIEEEVVKLIIFIEEEIKKRFGDNVYVIEDIDLEEVVVKLLIEKKFIIFIVEFCIGGMIVSIFINYLGILEVLLEGVVIYFNEVKYKRLGVKNEILDKYGVVSEEIVMEMVIGIVKIVGIDVSIVIIGIVGLGGGIKEKFVGLVYVGIYVKGKVEV